MGTERLTVAIQGMTCASCVSRIEQGLREQEGVIGARVNFAAQEATVAYDPRIFSPLKLAQVIERLGYDTPALSGWPGKEGTTHPARPQLDATGRGGRVAAVLWPAAAGLLGSLALVGLYLGLVTLAQDWKHATELIWGDRWLVAAIALGFGTQIGLYVRLRRPVQRHHRLGQCTALTAAGTGSSSLAMVACCLHHRSAELTAKPDRRPADPGAVGRRHLPEPVPRAVYVGRDRDQPGRHRGDAAPDPQK